MPNDRPPVIVVGGGLAGMAAAWRLAEADFDVTLFERLPRLGGKAGSKLPNEVAWGTVSDGNAHLGKGLPNRSDLFSDHGYHVFPRWYSNIRAVADELDFASRLQPSSRMATIRKPGDRRTFAKRYVEVLETIRLFASVIDLISRPDPQLKFLSLSAFLCSRWFNGASPVPGLDSFALRALATHGYDVSAKTTRQMLSQWVSKIWRHETWTSCQGSLQQTLIEPVHDAMKKAGCKIHFQHTLESLEFNGSTITRLEFSDHVADRRFSLDTQDTVLISALPPDVVVSFIDDRFYSIFPELHGLIKLRTMNSAGMDIHFNRRLEIPHGNGQHFSLHTSRWGLSGVDISDLWMEANLHKTVVQLVAGDVHLLTKHSDEHFATMVLNDFRDSVPFNDADVDHWVLHRNDTERLTLNEVGNWYIRPETHSGRISNLYLAGDFVRSDIDVASMEGAWVTGINAAQSICDDQKTGSRIPKEKSSHVSERVRKVFVLIRYPIGFIALLTRANGAAGAGLLIAGVLAWYGIKAYFSANP